MDFIAMDLIGEFHPPSSQGNRYALTGVCMLTGFTWCICRATMRPPRPSSTAECLRLIAHLRGEQASAASWEPRPPFEATEMD